MHTEKLARAKHPKIAGVLDLDNLSNFKRENPQNPQAIIDVIGLTRALQERGVSRGTACRNFGFTATAASVWQQAGFQVCNANDNCDAKVIEAAESYASDHELKWLILCGGDGDYSQLVTNLKAKGVRVEIWSLRHKTSRKLIKLADNIRYIDKFVIRPRKARRANSAASLPRVGHANDNQPASPAR